jgi:hypothetical protein
MDSQSLSSDLHYEQWIREVKLVINPALKVWKGSLQRIQVPHKGCRSLLLQC